ncbi:MAG: ATP-binding protein [Gammaproteobacteria bacterium]|nr:MAG: ATP-binding protein [Gammaproteobacteria bacterium]
MQPEAVEGLIQRAERLLERLEGLLPPRREPPDFAACHAFRWQRSGERGWLRAVDFHGRAGLDDLLGIDRQKGEVLRNTRQFLAGLPANNVLLWGPRGTGKSTLVRALLHDLHPQGLRLVEVDKADLVQLPEIADTLRKRPEYFILFCDDISFEAGDPAYKTLKAMLDGSLATADSRLLIYATSNRRHLLPEPQEENLQTRVVGTELHHGEAVEEKISLSERFGLWLAFHPFDQETYLRIAGHWLERLGAGPLDDTARAEALRWALTRGSRSGRVAWQFACDLAGRRGLGEVQG